MDLPKDRTMPKDRNTSFAQDPHTQQIDVKKPNSLLVDDLKMLLINYKENPEKWTLDYIAARYEISKELAGNANVFLYFGNCVPFQKNMFNFQKKL